MLNAPLVTNTACASIQLAVTCHRMHDGHDQ